MFKNKEKITKEFCQGRTLLFQPKTAEEAGEIQLRLFALGFGWRMGGQKVIMEQDCADNGLSLLGDGYIYYGIDDEEKKKGFFCTLSQFDKADSPSNNGAKGVRPLGSKKLRKAYDLLRKEVTQLRNKVQKLESKLENSGVKYKTGPR